MAVVNGKAKKVFVGMSGGVDSSVSAALLKKAGYDVTGVFIKVWSPDWLPCPWREERRDAMRVAAALDIPFMTLDLEAEYKKGVVDYMLDEYGKGRTPNPDVMCNKEIKFGSFLKKARELGADYIATGHYAQAVLDKTGAIQLHAGKDKNKDQSYFLWTLTQEQLLYVLFPVGTMEKAEVRKLAGAFKLPVADKKDSQGLCFIGKVEMKDFLSHYVPVNKGSVLDEQGKVIGQHDGAVFYTVGERHGFMVSKHGPHDSPYYVTAKDLAANTITVSQKSVFSENSRTVQRLSLWNVNWVNGQPTPGRTYGVRYRYRQELLPAVIDGAQITFESSQRDVPIGQSLVVYDGKLCFGGGIIESTE